ncbi:hypothetical protein K492DRAFT_129151 [Lichtheimia hyalospora FSU 10163]|nr:hypothetical protein K492DRAFT_129151 [Lichtheimia hyalospora FSU 10163]
MKLLVWAAVAVALLATALVSPVVGHRHGGGDGVRRFELNITSAVINPDCHHELFPALLINDQFPGPTLRVVKGDDVEVTVYNSVDQYDVPTTIHFHGIRQYGTVESDGVPFVTQAAIRYGESFTHRFRVTGQSGTYFYHAHLGLQDDTVQGAFIVHDSKDSWPSEYKEKLHEGGCEYDGERTLQISEWWHQDFISREEYYMSPKFTFDKGSDSVLINGRSIHPSVYELPEECPGYTVLDVEPGKTYRLRIIGGQTFRTFGLGIAGHTMTIIEVDGQMTKPYDTDWIEISPGQRISVLIHTHYGSHGDLVPIATSYRWRNHNNGMYTETGYAYLRYNKHETTKDKRDDIKYTPNLPVFPKDDKRDWIWPEIEPLHVEKHGKEENGLDTPVILNAPADRVLKLRAGPKRQPTRESRYLMNGRMPPVRHQPLLTELMQGELSMMTNDSVLEADGYHPDHATFPIKIGEVVDIVLQNVKAGPVCLAHPWHTHGHSHYQIASGSGEYHHDIHGDIRNFPTPLYRDVSMVYPDDKPDEEGGCGWTKIRIYSDNPGFWILHCHITAHMMQGKFAVLEESPELIEQYRLYK